MNGIYSKALIHVEVKILTSLMSPTSRFLVSDPDPLVSAGGPALTGVHGEEMVPVANVTTCKRRKNKHRQNVLISPPKLTLLKTPDDAIIMYG